MNNENKFYTTKEKLVTGNYPDKKEINPLLMGLLNRHHRKQWT